MNEFPESNTDERKNFEFENKHLVGVYSFTAPVIEIGLQDTMLHALTYAGLESYTLKPPIAVRIKVEG